MKSRKNKKIVNIYFSFLNSRVLLIAEMMFSHTFEECTCKILRQRDEKRPSSDC